MESVQVEMVVPGARCGDELKGGGAIDEGTIDAGRCPANQAMNPF